MDWLRYEWSVWFELYAWFFWLIDFKLDQECDRLFYLWVFCDHDFVRFALVPTYFVKGIACGEIMDLWCTVSVERDVD